MKYFFILIFSMTLNGFHIEALELSEEECKFSKLIQKDTIYDHIVREEEKDAILNLPVRIIFELKDRVFNYKGLENVFTQEEINCVYTKSPTRKQLLVKIIYNSDFPREKVIDHFQMTFFDQILRIPYHQQLGLKVRDIIIGECFNFFNNPQAYQFYEKPDDATFNEAMVLYNQERYDEALPFFLKSHEEDNGKAAFMLGGLYGRKRNFKKAAEYMREGALRHNPQSQFAYGIFYFDKDFPSNVIEKNFNKAFAWIHLSATQGFLPAIKFTYEFHQRFLPYCHALPS